MSFFLGALTPSQLRVRLVCQMVEEGGCVVGRKGVSLLGAQHA